MSLPVVNAPEVPESLTGTPGRPSGDFSMPKPLEKMNSEERQAWLRGNGDSKSWSESSLSAFEVADAPTDDKKSDEGDKSGDVTTIENLRSAKADEAGDASESSTPEESPETTRREQHQKSYQELPTRLAKELALEYEEAAVAGSRIPVSAELGEFLKHVLADSRNPARIYKHLAKNGQLVAAMHAMPAQSVLAIVQDIDQKVAAPEKRVTKAPPPAREVGGRGSSSGDEEKTAISRGDFRAFRRAANTKALERSR